MGMRAGLASIGQFLASKATVRGVIALCFTALIPVFAFGGFKDLAIAMIVAITGFYFDAKRENRESNGNSNSGVKELVSKKKETA